MSRVSSAAPRTAGSKTRSPQRIDISYLSLSKPKEPGHAAAAGIKDFEIQTQPVQHRLLRHHPQHGLMVAVTMHDRPAVQVREGKAAGFSVKEFAEQ